MIRFGILPALALLGVGLASGPTLWHMWYPSVREFCVTQLARLTPDHVVWYVLLLLASVSLGALTLALIRELVLSARLRRIIARRMIKPPENISQLRNRHRLQIPLVCIDEERPYAFCCGLMQPRIVVSSGLNKVLSEPEMEAVLLHEAAHASRRDPMKIFLSLMVARALFYTPIVNRLQKRYVLRLEVEADRAVVAALKVQPLAAALSKMLQSTTSAEGVGITATIANSAEERITYLLEPRLGLPPLIPPRVEIIANSLLVGGAGLLGGSFVSAVNRLIGSGAFCRM